MTDINENVKTVCSFYVSDWHLVTMLLPNIDKKINEGVKITTILENNLEENMTTLLEKLKLENKQKVLDIKWSNRDIENIDVKDIIENNSEIIINGSLEYINNVHQKIKQYLNEGEINKKITILDCYDINKYEKNIKQILDKHDKILNTAGEKDKEEYVTNIKVAN